MGIVQLPTYVSYWSQDMRYPPVADVMPWCTSKSNKELKKSGCGSIDYMTYLNIGVIITKWMDNNAVHIAPNLIGVEPMSSVNRWIPAEKCRKEIQCARIIKEYNGGMGGVDLADMLIALYRIAVKKTHRWYIKERDLIVLIVNDFTNIHTKQRPKNEITSVARHIATILIKRFRSVPGILALTNNSAMNPDGVSTHLLVDLLDKTFSKFSKTFATTIPSWIHAAFFNPEQESNE
eukprot:gene5662-10900_t